MADPEVVWIDTDGALDAELDALAGEPAYALDTEFHRERTYYPRLALVQLARPGRVSLVDPLAVDVSGLARVLDGPGLGVLHACGQDLEVLSRACGTVPARLFDTQLAAGFLGWSTPSLASLLAGVCKVSLPKADRLTDWLARPLAEAQRTYAAADVAHLLDLAGLLQADLERRGRLVWALDECEALRGRPLPGTSLRRAWWRIKDHRHLHGQARAVAQCVAAWREQRAARLDVPVRTVLADLALLGIAQRPPRTVEDLRRTRGLDERSLRGGAAAELLDAVAEGLALPLDEVEEPPTDELPRTLRPALALVSAWVSQRARDLDLDTTLLATRADLAALLRDDPDARLRHGWRAASLGEDVGHLLEGRAALAFDGRGGLRLVDLPEPPAEPEPAEG